MENNNRESASEKGVSLEAAVRSALQDTADCPRLPPDFAGHVEAAVLAKHAAHTPFFRRFRNLAGTDPVLLHL